MNSFILISKNPQSRTDYLHLFMKEHTISPFDVLTLKTDTPSIGIEQIRDMQKSVYFKPLKGDKKMIVIEEAQTLTPESQNALLKLLEEPPTNTYFFLSATSDAPFLPTILSRCKVIHLKEEKEEVSSQRKEELLQIYQKLTDADIAFKLSLAESLSSDKEKTRDWLKEMIYLLHEKMLQDIEKSREVIQILEQLQKAYTLLQTTNINLRLLLEHTFLEM